MTGNSLFLKDNSAILYTGEREEVIQETADGEIFSLDLEGIITSSNLLGQSVTGFEVHEIIGQNFSIFYLNEDVERGLPKDSLSHARSTTRYSARVWLEKKNRQLFFVKVLIKALVSRKGEVNGYTLILKDQTSQLRLVNRVKNYHFRYEHQHLFDNPYIGIFRLRLHGLKFIVINERANQILGERESNNIEDVFHDPTEFKDFLQKINENAHVSEFEFRVKRSDETWAKIDCRKLSTGGIIEGVLTDITKSKKQILELTRLNNEIDSFVYRASHDFRAPLTTLLGLIHLTEHDRQFSLSDYCNMMSKQVAHLDELLKELARMLENNRTEIVKEPVDFVDTIKPLFNELQNVTANIQVNYLNDNFIAFWSDRHRIQTIIKNILLSLLLLRPHYTPQSLVNISVNLSCAKAVIRICITGIEISEEDMPQLFKMFYKFNTKVKDSGLKLYIAKLVADKLGGKISISPESEQGTCFEIQLPNLNNQETKSL